MASKQGTSVRVDSGTHGILRSLSFLTDMSMAEIISIAIDEYLENRSLTLEAVNRLKIAKISTQDGRAETD